MAQPKPKTSWHGVSLLVGRSYLIQVETVIFMHKKLYHLCYVKNNVAVKCGRSRIFDNDRYTDLMEWNKDYFPISHALVHLRAVFTPIYDCFL